jgi:hypothetical protein
MILGWKKNIKNTTPQFNVDFKVVVNYLLMLE